CSWFSSDIYWIDLETRTESTTFLHQNRAPALLQMVWIIGAIGRYYRQEFVGAERGTLQVMMVAL
ncbi:hypothetical protein ACPA9J_21445, partial [Pseudomonas aeruginosa]